MKAWLRELLPKWEVPDVLLEVPEIPVTHTGKVDKDALRDLARRAGAEPRPEAAGPLPGADDRAFVSGLVEEVLGTAIDPGTSFFDAGGDSFGLVQLQVKLSRTYGEARAEGLRPAQLRLHRRGLHRRPGRPAAARAVPGGPGVPRGLRRTGGTARGPRPVAPGGRRRPAGGHRHRGRRIHRRARAGPAARHGPPAHRRHHQQPRAARRAPLRALRAAAGRLRGRPFLGYGDLETAAGTPAAGGPSCTAATR
ncbi:hypothetical protein GQS52_16055 [Streptomyces sp. SCUT-3]|nr:hypothetical protein GQS52_16055 [Streptomyces sp. SCUT-3]